MSEQPEFLTTEEAADISEGVSEDRAPLDQLWTVARLQAGPGVSDPCRGPSGGGSITDISKSSISTTTRRIRSIRSSATQSWNRSTIRRPTHRAAHANGVAANYRIGIARESVAELVDASASEVVFTAGATEANNLILRGFHSAQRRRVLISATEHSSITMPAQSLQDSPIPEWMLSPLTATDRSISLRSRSMLDDTVALVSIAAANSETGVINPLEEIARSRSCRRCRLPLRCDSVRWTIAVLDAPIGRRRTVAERPQDERPTRGWRSGCRSSIRRRLTAVRVRRWA